MIQTVDQERIERQLLLKLSPEELQDFKAYLWKELPQAGFGTAEYTQILSRITYIKRLQ